MNLKNYIKRFSLFRSQPWLVPKEEELTSLLALCKTSSEQDLVFDLLSRFSYVTGEKCGAMIKNIVSTIVKDWNLPSETTQIVATAYNNDPDSSNSILQFLKPVFVEFGWPSIKLVNKIGKAISNADQYPTIVLVDEFVGTGQTLCNRALTLRKDVTNYLSQKNLNVPFSISSCVIASMAFARDAVENEVDRFHSCLELPKGISDNFSGPERKIAEYDMLRLESELGQDPQNLPYPSFGYGKAEALYSMQNGNTPNSVFPIFWWNYLVGGKIRAPLLYRFG